MSASIDPGATDRPDALDRRAFLKVGAGFTLAAATAGIFSGCSDAAKAPASGYTFLKPADVELFTAVAPAVVVELDRLDRGVRPKVLEQLLHGIDATCAAIGAAGQAELRKLFDLLAIKPLRYVLTGVGDWRGASLADIDAFLNRWRSSRFATLNAGAGVLIKLSASNFYMLPESWPSTGYPGPLAYMFQAINA